MPSWLPGKFKQRETTLSSPLAEHLVTSPRWAAQPKIDGVAVAIRFRKNRPPEVYTAEPKKTGPREHTQKVPTLPSISPDDLDNTVVRAELFARRKDTRAPIPAQTIVGLVNAAPETSLRKQKELGIELVPALLTVERHNNHSTTGLPYKEQLALLRQIHAQLPGTVLPDTHTSEESKRTLINLVRTKRHPLTTEGVVFHDLEAGKTRATSSPASPVSGTIKAKERPDFDVYVQNVFPQQTDPQLAGGFEYSWTPRGPVVGRVGTGFSHELLRDMMRHPTKYIGMVAKVRSQGSFPAALLESGLPHPEALGALRAPSFKEWHAEK